MVGHVPPELLGGEERSAAYRCLGQHTPGGHPPAVPGLRCVASCCLGRASPRVGPRFGSAHPCSTCPGGASLRAARGSPKRVWGTQPALPAPDASFRDLSPPCRGTAQPRCRCTEPVEADAKRSCPGGGREAEGETYQVAAQRCLHARSVRCRRHPAVRELCHVVQPADELLQLAAEHLLNKARQKVLVIYFSNKEEAAAGIHG